VRFHAKPSVNGRELTAEDVKFTFERMLTEACRNASMYRAIAKVEAVDRYTVRFTLSEPFAWFLDMVASPMAGGIVARECVEKWGDLKKPEAVIGTGPWMLECYRPNVSLTMVRHPGYFVPGLGRAADRRGHACAVRLKPDYSAAHRGLGRALERAGRTAEAAAAYATGLEVAARTGDLQTKKGIEVFLRRLTKAGE
jgi:hypothetical protein